MRRADLEHVVAAAAQIVGEDEFVIVGSQAILGSFPDAPASLLRSQEADVYPRRSPEKAIRIEGAIGDGSPFHQTYGYYAHAVGPETAKAPVGWEERLVPFVVPPRVATRARATALCLEPHDLVLAKLAANRDRDWDFAKDALAAGLVNAEILVGRVPDLPVNPEMRTAISSSISAIAAQLRGSE